MKVGNCERITNFTNNRIYKIYGQNWKQFNEKMSSDWIKKRKEKNFTILTALKRRLDSF